MRKISLVILAALVLALSGCSKKTEQTAVTPQSTPDAARLKADSERLQQATANAAREREKAAQAAASATPTPSQP